MSTFKHMIRKARSRELLNRVLARGGFGLLVGLSAGVVLLLLDRFAAGVDINWKVHVVLGAAGFLIGGINAFSTRPDAMTMAVYLDRALKLKDRIGTIEAFDKASAMASADADFLALLRADTARLAAGIDVSAVMPIHLRPAWLGALILAAALWAGVNFLPEIASADSPDPSSPAVAQLQQRQQEVRDLHESITDITRDLPKTLPADEQLQGRLEALDRLAEQFSSDNPPSDQELASQRDETAATMSDLADQLAEQAARDQAAAEELQRRFANMEAQQRPQAPMSAQEFSEALQRGDFGEAARHLEELIKNADALTEDDKAATASHLRELSDHIEQSSAAKPDPAIDQHRQQVEDSLRNEGVIEEQTLDELLNSDAPQSQEELEQTLRENNIDEEVARKLARELRELRDQQQTDQQVQQDARDLAETLNQTADQIETPPSPPSPPSPTPTPPQPSAQQPTPPTTQPKAQQQPPSPQQQQQPSTQNQPPQSQQGEQRNSTQQQQQQQPQQQGDQQQQSQGQSQKPQESQQQQQQQPGESQGQSQQSQSKRDQSSQQQQQGTQQQQSADKASKSQDQQQQPGGQRDLKSESESTQPAQQTAQQPAKQPSPQPGGPAESQPAPSPQQGADPNSRQQQDQQQPGQKGRSRQKPEPGAQPSPSSEESLEPGAQPSDQFDPSKLDPQTLQEMLKRFAERPQDAQDKQQISERMRQKARELADNMTPEQRRQWAEALQRERGDQPPDSPNEMPSPGDADEDQPNAPAANASQPTPGDQANAPGSSNTKRGGSSNQQGNSGRHHADQTQDVDLTGDETADKLIAQWLSDQQQLAPADAVQAGGPPAAAPAPVRRAQELAERAVNDAAVHKRYHQAIKRYFGRLDQTANKAASQTKPAPSTGENNK